MEYKFKYTLSRPGWPKLNVKNPKFFTPENIRVAIFVSSYRHFEQMRQYVYEKMDQRLDSFKGKKHGDDVLAEIIRGNMRDFSPFSINNNHMEYKFFNLTNLDAETRLPNKQSWWRSLEFGISPKPDLAFLSNEFLAKVFKNKLYNGKIGWQNRGFQRNGIMISLSSRFAQQFPFQLRSYRGIKPRRHIQMFQMDIEESMSNKKALMDSIVYEAMKMLANGRIEHA